MTHSSNVVRQANSLCNQVFQETRPLDQYSSSFSSPSEFLFEFQMFDQVDEGQGVKKSYIDVNSHVMVCENFQGDKHTIVGL